MATIPRRVDIDRRMKSSCAEMMLRQAAPAITTMMRIVFNIAYSCRICASPMTTMMAAGTNKVLD